jgi:hypothetical protein
MSAQHNLAATVFVYRNTATGAIRAEYLDYAKVLEDDQAWEHLATLEPRLWIQSHYTAVGQEDEALRSAHNPHLMAEQISLMMTFANATLTERQQDVLAAALKTILEP